MASKQEKDRPDKGRASDAEGEVEQVVRRYYSLLNQLEPDLAALQAVLSSKLRQVEHPNALSPLGVSRGRAELLADQQGGEELLTGQSFEVLEVLVSGSRAAVRGVWSGALRDAAGRLPAGASLVAHFAAFLKVKGGKVVEHEVYECYQPIGG